MNEAITSIIPFLELIDKIINRLKTKKQNRKQMFDEFIEPLFVELQPIVDDYFTLFRRSRDLVRKSQNGEQDIKIAVEEIRFAREDLLIARRKVVALATIATKEIKDKKTIDFFKKVVYFFYGSELEVNKNINMSEGANLVELLDYVVDGKMIDKREGFRFSFTEGKFERRERRVVECKLRKEAMLKYINITLRNLENRWIAIAQSYALLRIRCLSQ